MEAGDVARGEPFEAEVGVKDGELNGCAVEERGVQDVLHAVDVVQRQDVQRAVLVGPLPGAAQGDHLRRETSRKQDMVRKGKAAALEGVHHAF